MQQQQPTTHGAFNLTTHHIQQYLDENKSLILKILENQNSEKFRECAETQAKLHRNLTCLASIADRQPPPPPLSSIYAQAAMNYMQHQQSQLMVSHPSTAMETRPSMVYGQQLPYLPLQQQQALQSQLGTSSVTRGGQPLHPETSLETGGTTVLPNFGGINSGEGWQSASKVTGSPKEDKNGSTKSAEDHGRSS